MNMKYFLPFFLMLGVLTTAKAQYDPQIQKNVVSFHATALSTWGAANVVHALSYGIGKKDLLLNTEA